jgi:hypothetical protein
MASGVGWDGPICAVAMAAITRVAAVDEGISIVLFLRTEL